MIKNLKRYKRALEKEGKLDEAAAYNFFPTTYNLPNEYSIFSDEFKKGGHSIWIMKPVKFPLYKTSYEIFCRLGGLKEKEYFCSRN